MTISLWLKSKLTAKKGITLSIFTSNISSVLQAMIKANSRKRVFVGGYKCFPTSASEAKRPQQIVKGPE